MANWILREGAPSLEVRPDRKIVLIKSKRRSSIRPGDCIILMSPKWTFTHQSEVLRAPEKPEHELSELEQTPGWSFEVAEWTRFPSPVEFDLFSASLLFVRNWKQPHLHLRPAYRSLSDPDLQTLVNGEPFLARETYLSLMEALPETLRQSFIAEHALPLNNEYRERPFFDLANLAIDFIEQRVVSVGTMVVETDDLWREIAMQAYAPGDLEAYFADEDNQRGNSTAEDSVRTQAALFRNVLGELNGKNGETGALFPSVREALTSNSRLQLERRFEFLFRGRNNELP
jgi:hypothetical protein